MEKKFSVTNLEKEAPKNESSNENLKDKKFPNGATIKVSKVITDDLKSLGDTDLMNKRMKILTVLFKQLGDVLTVNCDIKGSSIFIIFLTPSHAQEGFKKLKK